MKEIETAFNEITKLLFGNRLTDIDSYAKWLGKHIPLPIPARSVISGKEVWIPPSFIYLKIPFNKSKIISLEEMGQKTSSPFTTSDICNAATKDLVAKFIKPVAYYVGNFRYQDHENFERVSGGGGGRNVYFSEDTYLGVKNLAFCNYVLNSENVFGSHNLTASNFCIHTYNSTALSRCFEVDACSNSSDLLFCHNSENLQDCMFCFNAKNLKYAIGNTPLAPDQYRHVKSEILTAVSRELLQTKNLKYDIFNIGDKHGS